MPTIKAIYDFLNTKAPFSLQEDWDNSGFLVGDPNTEVTKVLTALDITDGYRPSQIKPVEFDVHELSGVLYPRGIAAEDHFIYVLSYSVVFNDLKNRILHSLTSSKSSYLVCPAVDDSSPYSTSQKAEKDARVTRQ